MEYALQDVYRSYGALGIFVAEEFGENLEAIAGQGTLPSVTFNLIDWSEAKGRLEELYAAFCADNPDHWFAIEGSGAAETSDGSVGKEGGY